MSFPAHTLEFTSRKKEKQQIKGSQQMHNWSSTIRISGTVITMMALVLTAGCESTSNWLKGRKTADADEIVLGAPDVSHYINELYALASGDPATQAEIYADAEAAATLTPRTSTELRYALVVATPGHSESDSAKGQSLLRDVLAQKEMMNSAEIELATIYLRNVEARYVLETEAQRLRGESSRAATTEEAAIAQRIARVETENRQLRESLADAEAKLEAITSIERSIREQSEN
jgi:hypothetical protein